MDQERQGRGGQLPRRSRLPLLRGFGILVGLALAACAATGPTKPEDKRAEMRKMRDRVLEEFYAAKPAIREELKGAVGYGVFDASQVNLVLYVGSEGAGMLVDNANGREIFMKMARAGTGPGVGYKDYSILLVFKNRELFNTFSTLGADVGMSADATVKLGGGKGVALDGSASFNPMLSTYQMTQRGAVLQANWGGVAFLPDEELNAVN